MDRKLRVMLTLVVGLLLLLIISPVYADQADSNIQEGLKHYDEGQFPEAEKSFSEARLVRPKDRRLDYNLGSANYKQGKYQEALEIAEKAIEIDGELLYPNYLKTKCNLSIYNLQKTYRIPHNLNLYQIDFTPLFNLTPKFKKGCGGNQVGFTLFSIILISFVFSLLALRAICSPNKTPFPIPEPL